MLAPRPVDKVKAINTVAPLTGAAVSFDQKLFGRRLVRSIRLGNSTNSPYRRACVVLYCLCHCH